jgi:hypothetical protein
MKMAIASGGKSRLFLEPKTWRITMINQFFNRLSSPFAFIKKLQLKQALIIAFASFFLLINTACGAQPKEVSSTRGADNRQSVQRQNNPTGQKTGLREYTDRQDGKSRPDLSSYVDNDSRQTAGTNAKAKALIDRARDNSTRAIENPQDFVDNYRKGAPLNERVDNISKDIGSAVQNLKDDASAGAQKNTRQLRSGADQAGNTLKQAVEDTKQNIKATSQDAANSVKKAID